MLCLPSSPDAMGEPIIEEGWGIIIMENRFPLFPQIDIVTRSVGVESLRIYNLVATRKVLLACD